MASTSPHSQGFHKLEGDNLDDSGTWCGMKAAEAFWLFIFCITGVGLGMAFEFLDLHSSKHAPASSSSFFLCLIGYWSQTILGGLYALTRPNPLRGSWTKPVLQLLFISAIFDGGAQALDYVGQTNGGYMLFTIFHTSVTVFSCVIAMVVLKVTSNPQYTTTLDCDVDP